MADANIPPIEETNPGFVHDRGRVLDMQIGGENNQRVVPTALSPKSPDPEEFNNGGNEPPAIIVFPANLRELNGKTDTTGTDVGFPQIEFAVRGDDADGKQLQLIYMPLTKGIQFSDGGDYSTLDLGTINNLLVEPIQNILNGDFGDAIGNSKKILNSFDEKTLGSTGVRIKSILAARLLSKIGLPEFDPLFAIKKIVAPNQNSRFNSNKLRNFSFNFQLVANSVDDTAAIKRIHEVFRRYVYASSNAGDDRIVLDYPPIWTVRFLLGAKENPYIPKLFSLYLTNFSCTFNSGANAFRYDGSPLVIDMVLDFTETRVLVRQDIDNLNEDSGGNRGINPKTGLASNNWAGKSLDSPSNHPVDSTPTSSMPVKDAFRHIGNPTGNVPSRIQSTGGFGAGSFP